jgi:nucleoside-diphosphate-sugar epimerase
MKVLLLGSDGYLGSKLKKELKDRNFDLYSVDINPKDNATIKLDVTNFDEIDNYLKNENFDIIISLIGILPGVFPKNTLYNKNLSSVSYLKNIKCQSHFIFASSTAVYSNDSNLTLATENPFEIYGESKLDSENLIKNFVDSFTILRIGTIISKDRRGGIMAILRRFKNGKLIWIPKNGDVVHPFIHANDVVKSFIYVCENIDITKGMTYDIVSQERDSFNQIGKNLKYTPRIIGNKFLDFLISKIGYDMLPILGISKWHINALKYNLKISNNNNKWNYFLFMSSTEAVRESLAD